MAACTRAVGTASTSNAATYASGAFTPALNDLLIVFADVSASLTNPAACTSSIGGFTFTPFVVKQHSSEGTPTDSTYGFVADALVSSATSQTVTINVTGDNGTGCSVVVCRVSGMTKTGLAAIRQFKTGGGAAASVPEVVFDSACLTENPTFAVCGKSLAGAGPDVITEPTGWTEQDDLFYDTPDQGIEYATRDSGFTGTTVTWGSSVSGSYSAIIVELDSSAGGLVIPIFMNQYRQRKR